MTLSTLEKATDADSQAKQLTFFGAMLFSRGVSGTRYAGLRRACIARDELIHCHVRVLSCKDTKTIGGIDFASYGAHYTEYPTAYLTVACAIGMARDEIDQLMTKLRKTIHEWRKQHTPASSS